MRTLNRPSAIVGAAKDVGRLPGETSLMLHARLAHEAANDAGLELREIDGIVTLGSFSDRYLMHAVAVGEYLALPDLVYADTVGVGGASAVAALTRAHLQVASGNARHVVVVSGDDQLSGMTRDLAVQAMFENRHPVYETPYGPTTAAAYAMAARSYLHAHRLEPAMLDHATRQSREFAALRPDGIKPSGATLEEIRASRVIADPLRMFHCAPIADGGGAVVISAERHDEHVAVELLGGGEAHRAAHLAFDPTLDATSVRGAVSRALGNGGITIDQIDVALVYDAFASSVAMTLEGLGLAEPGTALLAYRDGDFGPAGRVPVNPHGGLLSGGHPGYPGGMLHVVEAVEQLRGTSPTQVDSAACALLHGSGGISSSHAVVVLGRADQTRRAL